MLGTILNSLGPVMTGRWCWVNAVPREEVCEGEGLLKPDFSDFFRVVGDGIPGSTSCHPLD